MANCFAVQRKMPCIFNIAIQNEPSTKRVNQCFRVTAFTEQLNPEVAVSDIEFATATEKIDGTCCLIQEYEGRPWLWARLDRKPNRGGEKKFLSHQRKIKAWKESGQIGSAPVIKWDQAKDFKEVSTSWIPASGVDVIDSMPQPDNQGHTPGWVPLEKLSRQYCWHLASVDLDLGICLVLMPDEDSGELVIRCRYLSDLCGKTCELIGTNINGNPYGLGSKQQPLHLLVVHGSVPVSCPSPLDGAAVRKWMEKESEEFDANRIEGVVWHCPSGALFKLHRHHLNLCWPITRPRLSQQAVKVEVDSAQFHFDIDIKSQFSLLESVNGCKATKLSELDRLLNNGR